jgi:hypothetical protein
MKRALIFLAIELVIAFIIAIGLNNGEFTYDLMTIFGLVNAIGALLILLLALILSVAKHKDAKAVLISACLLLLIGIAACSGFPMNMRMM